MNLKVYLVKKENIQKKIEDTLVNYLSVIFDVADLDNNKIVEGLAFEILAEAHPDDESIKETASNWVIEHNLFSKYSAKSYQEYIKKKEANHILFNDLDYFTGLTYEELEAIIDEKVTNLQMAKKALHLLAKWCLALTNR